MYRHIIALVNLVLIDLHNKLLVHVYRHIIVLVNLVLIDLHKLSYG